MATMNERTLLAKLVDVTQRTIDRPNPTVPPVTSNPPVTSAEDERRAIEARFPPRGR
jgi:hypothetical protein